MEKGWKEKWWMVQQFQRTALVFSDSTKKTKLFSLFSGILRDSFQCVDNQLVIIEGDNFLNKLLLQDSAALVPFNHDEVDSHMILRCAHAVPNGHKKILIYTVDIDVVALAGILEEEAELWVSFCPARLSSSWQQMRWHGLWVLRKY